MDITEIDLDDSEIYSPRQSIHLGGTTKFLLRKLRNQGDISETDYDNVLMNSVITRL